MRNQPTGAPKPRDNGDEGSDEAAGSELVDLGESPLPGRLDVPPASVRSVGRRLDPRLAAGAAVAIVVVALLGTGPLAPKPATAPSPSLVATTTSSPVPTDSCPVDQVDPTDPPIVSLGLLNTNLARTSAAGVGPSIDAVDVVAPVVGAAYVYVGRRMQLKIRNVTCLELLGIDLFDASRPRGAALTVRPPSPLERGATSAIWEGPPAGDWIVRVALQLRTPGGEAASVWAVYLFRLNSGYVAWSSPVPEGAGGGVAEGPLVTPAAPCGPLPTDGATPPVVDLVAAGASHPGTVGDYLWNGVVVSAGMPASVLAGTPIDGTGPVQLVFEGQVCATSWRFDVAPWPGDSTVFNPTRDFSPENPAQRPEIASQNTFTLEDVYGTYVIQASFTFTTGEHEVVYWVVRAGAPAVPAARIAPESAGEHVALLRGCGASFQIGDRYGDEICGDYRWPELLAGPVLSLDGATELRLDADDQLISGWSATYVEQALIAVSGGAPSCVFDLTSGGSGIGLASLEIPPLPPGAWSLKVVLTVRAGTNSSIVPYFIRVEVPGDPSPGPSQSCFID